MRFERSDEDVHNSDRTLLASLGFADPDKRDPRHDWACQYLAQPERVRKLIEVTVLSTVTKDGSQITAIHTLPEVEVAKGRGQYRRSVGFVDLAIGIEAYREHQSEQLARKYLGIIVEVKIHQKPVGDVIRQITLYRSYHPDFTPWRELEGYDEMFGRNQIRRVPRDKWPFAVLATLYEIDREDAEMLASRDILHVRLGAGFDDYVESRQQFGEKAKSLVL